MLVIKLLIGSLHQDVNVKIKKMRDNKVLETFLKHTEKKLKEMNLFKFLKKEVETGASGTQDYVIKKGPKKDKIAKK